MHARHAAEFGGARVAASVISSNVQIGQGTNQKHTVDIPHVRKPRSVGCHAEIAALAAAAEEVNYRRGDYTRHIRGSVCVVARAKRTARGGPVVPGLARPCNPCMETLRAFGIREVVYTTGETDVDGMPETKTENLL